MSGLLILDILTVAHINNPAWHLGTPISLQNSPQRSLIQGVQLTASVFSGPRNHSLHSIRRSATEVTLSSLRPLLDPKTKGPVSFWLEIMGYFATVSCFGVYIGRCFAGKP